MHGALAPHARVQTLRTHATSLGISVVSVPHAATSCKPPLHGAHHLDHTSGTSVFATWALATSLWGPIGSPWVTIVAYRCAVPCAWVF